MYYLSVKIIDVATIQGATFNQLNMIYAKDSQPSYLLVFKTKILNLKRSKGLITATKSKETRSIQ